MSNHDLTIANGPGINVRQDIEAALQALGTTFQGTVAPLATYPCQMWADSGAGLLKMRNIANSAWITLCPLDTANMGHLPLSGGALTGPLTSSSSIQAAGAISTGTNFNCSVPNGSQALLYLGVASARTWVIGTQGDGTFMIYDGTAGAQRMVMGGNGVANFLTNMGVMMSVGAGLRAEYQCVVAGQRNWSMGQQAGGTFGVADNTAGAYRLTIDSAGAAIIPISLNTNQLTAALVTANSNMVTPNFAIDNAPATSRAIVFRSNGLMRWAWQCTAVAEGGSNSGSDFGVNSYNDAGTNIGSVFSIVRATRVVSFAVAIVNGPSDRSLKENIKELSGSLDRVLQLQGVSFNFINDPEQQGHIGLIAQDVQPIVPEVMQEYTTIVTEPVPEGQEGQGEVVTVSKLAVDYPKLTALLIEAVKELNAKVTALEGVAR